MHDLVSSSSFPETPPGATQVRQAHVRPNQASLQHANRLRDSLGDYTTDFDKTFLQRTYSGDRILTEAPIDHLHSLKHHSLLLPWSGPIPDFGDSSCIAAKGFAIRTGTSEGCSTSVSTTLHLLCISHFRFLASSFNVASSDMTTISSAPGSPPDLSGSRSSKSSSSCSTSQFSTPEGVLTDVSNFEEIGLEDEKHNQYPKVSGNASEPVKSTSKIIAQSRESEREPPSKSAQTQVSPKRPTYPSLQGQVNGAIRQNRRDDLRMPKSAGVIGRTFTSPSLPAFSPSSQALQQRTRSTSPRDNIRSPVSSLAVYGGGLRPSQFSIRQGLGLPQRRGSWQPSRKSITDLEAECHDSDDELPEDTSLWNVPVSPRPPEDRVSPLSSHRGSPDRESTPRPIPLAHAVSAPAAPLRKQYSFQQPHSKRKPPPPRTSSLSATTFSNPSSPRTRMSLRDTRAKSWTLAISELSEEARVLTETLEHHAAMVERAHEDRIQNGHRSTRPSLESNSNRSSRSVISLPPIQKSNLDFMPISKEKEAILSRTRPSWLPPKDPKEEKKHLKEYQRMMAAAMEAERKRDEKLQMNEFRKDDTREALNKIWEQFLAPDIDPELIDRQTRELWWRGVSLPKIRGKVWERAMGNQLALNQTSYEKALQRAKDIQSKTPEDLTDKEKIMLNWFVDIQRDAETAFPELNLFQQGGPLWQNLVDVCEAYACYRSDTGYVYGVQLIGALLLLQLHAPSAAFVLLANCLNRPMPLAFLTNDLGATARSYGLAVETLRIKFPRLHDYLFDYEGRGGLAMSGEEVFEPMFRTLFSNGLDLERLCRVWDVWIFDGDRTLVRAAVAILGCLQSQIYNISGSIDLRRRNIQEMLGWGPHGRNGTYWDLGSIGDEDTFMEEVREAGKLDYTGH